MNKAFNGIGAPADFHPRDYRFPRQRSDRTPLEKSPPPCESWTSTTVGALLIVAFMFAAFWAAGAWAWVR